MRHKIFLYLLKMFSRTEKDRIAIHKVLQEQVIREYSEQTPFGNVYNANIEFIMANAFILKRLEETDVDSITIVKSGLNTSTNEGILALINEEIEHGNRVATLKNFENVLELKN